jgi:ferrous iron transport protein A
LQTTLNTLKKGEKAIIKDFDIDTVPLKLLEMGCLPGNMVELLQIAPFGDPLYLNINGSHVAIRVETAKEIEVEIIKTTNA